MQSENKNKKRMLVWIIGKSTLSQQNFDNFLVLLSFSIILFLLHFIYKTINSLPLLFASA